MEKEIVYGSWHELDAQDARGSHRYGEPRSSETAIVHPSDYISLWSQKMYDNDPDGTKADKIAEKYRR